jgi:hypothetical protein
VLVGVMSEETVELLKQVREGKRVWKAPAETKDELAKFQRKVVLPLRQLAKSGEFRLLERAETYRGARFIVRVEIVEGQDNVAVELLPPDTPNKRRAGTR